jgi:hypothetical protein
MGHEAWIQHLPSSRDRDLNDLRLLWFTGDSLFAARDDEWLLSRQ